MAKLKIIDHPSEPEWNALLNRPPSPSGDFSQSVQKMLTDIKNRGDAAVDEYVLKFDGVLPGEKKVQVHEFEQSGKELSDALKTAIERARENIEKFHRSQIISEAPVEIEQGIRCWRKSVGIEKVGLYIPGGTAPLFSTLLMLGIPARLAGCREIVLCTPPQKDGRIHPAILFTARLLGLNNMFRIGGVQAIGAMAYGTESIPRVYKIFGPGNQWVTEAKKLVQLNGVAIDMPAGPSELAVYADETSVPEYVAADLLSQCEHGGDSQVILVASNRQVADQVNDALNTQLHSLPRKSVAEQSVQNSRIFIISNRTEAMKLLNTYAPEHLILACADAEKLSESVINAGSVFIGNYAPESAGDYASGTNHTLPTNGFARAYGGVSVDSFIKKISFQQITKQGLESIGPTIMEMAAAEGLEGHARAVNIRL